MLTKDKEIAKELKISNAYITKIIKKDPRYIDEKNFRKSQNKIKNVVETKEYINQKRSINSILDSYMKKQHIQASIELSGRSSISNRAYRKWNSSAYKYNDKTKTYNLKRNINCRI